MRSASCAPRPTSSSALPGVRFQSTTSWPPSRRRPASACPMRPMPSTEILMDHILPAVVGLNRGCLVPHHPVAVPGAGGRPRRPRLSTSDRGHRTGLAARDPDAAHLPFRQFLMEEAEAGGRQGLYACIPDRLATHLAPSVLAPVEPADGVVHVPEMLSQLLQEQLVALPVLPLGPRVGRMLVDCGQLLAVRVELVEHVPAYGPPQADQALVFSLQHGALPSQRRTAVLCCPFVCHGPVPPPAGISGSRPLYPPGHRPHRAGA